MYLLKEVDYLVVFLQFVLLLKLKVVYIKYVKKNCGVSYGNMYVIIGEEWIVIVLIGYVDGYNC